MQTLRFANEFCSLMLTKLAYRTRFPLQRQEISAKENYFSYLLALITACAHCKPYGLLTSFVRLCSQNSHIAQDCICKDKSFFRCKFFYYLDALIAACAHRSEAAIRTRFPLQRQEISAKENYFSYLDALITACAPASRAAGTRNGEQET